MISSRFSVRSPIQLQTSGLGQGQGPSGLPGTKERKQCGQGRCGSAQQHQSDSTLGFSLPQVASLQFVSDMVTGKRITIFLGMKTEAHDPRRAPE